MKSLYSLKVPVGATSFRVGYVALKYLFQKRKLEEAQKGIEDLGTQIATLISANYLPTIDLKIDNLQEQSQKQYKDIVRNLEAQNTVLYGLSVQTRKGKSGDNRSL